MKIYYNHLLLFILFTLFSHQNFAQDSIQTPLELGKIEPYLLNITYNKTTHLIFPSTIRYVDLGSDYLIADKAEDAENVLRIKAAEKDFEPETNFSVITEDGRFYNFNVYYSPFPENLSYNLLTMQKKMEKFNKNTNQNEVYLNELGKQSPSLVGLVLKTIYTNNKREIKHIGTEKYGIQFTLMGLYIHNGSYYFHTEIKNRSTIPFEIECIDFRIVDKKLIKRTVIQDRLLKPLRIYQPLEFINGKSLEQNVYLLDQFTLEEDQVLQIELFEKNGGRHQILQVENLDLIRARLIDEMHLKF